MSLRIRALLGKLGVDVHNRGLITVAEMFRDSGMEVVYLGNALPVQIVQTAMQEAVDVVGVSSLGGAHLTLGQALVEEAKRQQIKDQTVFLIGGVFPPQDISRLKDLGFDAVFTPGSGRSEIVSTVQDLVHKRTERTDS
jgi:methylmalonyl-CoA mutase C-terminal domain/subunit